MRTRIKICGLTREQDVVAAAEAGADALGFVLYAASSRAVTVQRAAELARCLPPFVQPVLLFVNATAAEVQAGLAAVPHALLQFHGDEPEATCASYARPYIRAARVQSGFDLLKFSQQYESAQAVLLDAHVDGYGGGGKVFDWSLVTQNARCPLVLSGGLTPANVTDGVLQVRPWAVDVSSGVEVSKGIKCAVKMRQFVAAVRAADTTISNTNTLAKSNPNARFNPIPAPAPSL
jgi:phosphoribosylanthranilate isomerase